MTARRIRISEQALITPKAAAVAGLLFAVLQIIGLALIRSNAPSTSGQWAANDMQSVTLAVTLIPFAGMTFLWFMGVVRAGIGRQEDQFFSTIFLGSGLLYLAMTFVAAGLAGGALALYSAKLGGAIESEAYILVGAVIDRINNVYAVRMAGMHMIVLGTIWFRTGTMPRWLAFITYLFALILLISTKFFPWIEVVFPTWVGMISLFILIQNYRNNRGSIADDALILDN